VTAALVFCALVAVLLPPAARAAAGKGIMDAKLEAATTSPSTRAAIVRDLGRGLGVRWVKLTASWTTLEPVRGGYDQAALERLDALVHDLRAAGTRVILTTQNVPEWASDQRFWDDPPAGMARGYRSFYPIREDALGDYGRLGETLARRYGSSVYALECWNEPNLWTFLYPQRTAGDAYFGARVYLRMLKAFSRGVRRAGTRMRVIAGATAPIGLNDKLRTSPQRFAGFLKRSGAAGYFDGYSHHPYTPGGSVNHAPDEPPNDPSTTVTLYNLGTLLRLFPGKPFYLTEYGFNTRPSRDFGGFSVTERAQARYLKTAYAIAGRHPQVKALFWFLIRDVRPADGPADAGVYTGLRHTDGTRKPAWYAYRAVR
jgi:hypothetical protein